MFFYIFSIFLIDMQPSFDMGLFESPAPYILSTIQTSHSPRDKAAASPRHTPSPPHLNNLPSNTSREEPLNLSARSNTSSRSNTSNRSNTSQSRRFESRPSTGPDQLNLPARHSPSLSPREVTAGIQHIIPSASPRSEASAREQSYRSSSHSNSPRFTAATEAPKINGLPVSTFYQLCYIF